MLLYLINNSSLWKNIDPKVRFFRIFMLGAVLYILLHSFINSKYTQGNEFINDHKKYLYYVIIFDFTLFMFSYYNNSPQITSQKKKKIKSKNQTNKEYSCAISPEALQNLKPNVKASQICGIKKEIKQEISKDQNDIKSIQIPIYKDSNTNIANETISDESLPIYDK